MLSGPCPRRSAAACLLERCEVGPDPRRVRPHVAPPDAGLGPHVHCRAVRPARYDANHHIILEAEPTGRGGRLDAPGAAIVPVTTPPGIPAAVSPASAKARPAPPGSTTGARSG